MFQFPHLSSRARLSVAIGLSVVLISAFTWSRWKATAPRRECIATLTRLQAALETNSADAVLNAIVIPQALANRTRHEQIEFISKALRDEISPEGIVVLRKNGKFGALKDLFPAEGEGWANQAGARIDDCSAFRLDRQDVRAEVVLLRPPSDASDARYTIIRCNNVKQLGGSSH